MVRELTYFEEGIRRIQGLCLYQKVNEDPVMTEFLNILKSIAARVDNKDMIAHYYKWLYKLTEKAEKEGYYGNIFNQYVIDLFLKDENHFSLACENGVHVKGTSSYQMAYRDVEILRYILGFDIQNICGHIGAGEKVSDYRPMRPLDHSAIAQIEMANNAEAILEHLMWIYGNLGCGSYASHKMLFLNENGIITGMETQDPVTFSDIIGNKTQKEALISNTEAFLAGAAANNVLLVGPAGTGKSACVKALANGYYQKKLRLIKIEMSDAYMLKDLLEKLAKRGKRFIIFLDDLVLDETDSRSVHLQSLLKGDVEGCPPNVLFYAASTQTVSGTTNTLIESSLADRFGLILEFPAPTQAQYQDIVSALAQKKQIPISEDFLREQALTWEANSKRMSGRKAKQFIHNVIGELRKM